MKTSKQYRHELLTEVAHCPRYRGALWPFAMCFWTLMGTCTKVELIEAKFLADYRDILAAANPQAGSLVTEWETALNDVRAASPQAGWTVLDAPSTAPAAADPYILAHEAAKLLMRRQVITTNPPDAYRTAYAKNPAPWRDEFPAVLQQLQAAGLGVAFISNSDPVGIRSRLDALRSNGAISQSPLVMGNASKFMLREVLLGAQTAAAAHRDLFEALLPAEPCKLLRRPIYLRRGHYFDAICEALHQLLKSRNIRWEEVLVVGDVYELDLALPKALGAHVHLVERADPYQTYDFEFSLLPPHAISNDLLGVVAHVARSQTAG